MNIILSFPRSGVTFTRYIIEVLSGKATVGPPYSKNPIDYAVVNPIIHKEKGKAAAKNLIAVKLHGEDKKSCQLIHGMMKRKCPLMMLLRSPL